MSQHDTLKNLVKAVDSEMDESWECNSYHPSLRPALEAARAALATPAQAQQSEPDDTIQFRGVDDTSEMLAVRRILESKGVYLSGRTIADIVESARAQQAGAVLTDAQVASLPGVVEALDHFVNDESDDLTTAWLVGQIRMHLTTPPAPAQPAAQPVQGVPDVAMVKRLQDAIEGECDGLAVTEQHARAILEYVLASPTPPAQQKGGEA